MKSLTEKMKFISRVFGTYDIARNEKNIAVDCPYCASRGKGKKKLVIRLHDMCGHCWVCGKKFKSLVPILKRYSPKHLQEYLDQFYIGDKTLLGTTDEQVVTLPSDFCLLANTTRQDPDYNVAVRYLTRRNINEDDFWLYKFGISNEDRWKRRIIVPSFDKNGLLNYFVARAVHATMKPKYDMPDVPKTGIIFNELYIDWTKQLVLCEGVFDAFKCGVNTVPLLGSDINEESLLFEKIVINETPVALALDFDMRHSKTPKIVSLLESYDIHVVLVDIDDDPGSMTKDAFTLALENAKPFTWKKRTFERLDRMVNVGLRL